MTIEKFAAPAANVFPLPPLLPPLLELTWRDIARLRRTEIFFVNKMPVASARLNLLRFEPGTLRVVPIHFTNAE